MGVFEIEPGLAPALDPDDPATVRAWFDQAYTELGLDYLRPPEAYPVFLEILGARPGDVLLDVACGAGLLLADAGRDGLVAHGLDFSTVALKLARQVAPAACLLLGDAQRLPYADQCFDCVSCIGALERLPDRSAAVMEMKRVIRPGGRVCIMVRNSRTLGWTLGVETFGRRNLVGHQDADTIEYWSALFVDAGFEIRNVLPDQWFWQRVRHAFGVSWARQRRRITRPVFPKRFANELIFVLSTGT